MNKHWPIVVSFLIFKLMILSASPVTQKYVKAEEDNVTIFTTQIFENDTVTSPVTSTLEAVTEVSISDNVTNYTNVLNSKDPPNNNTNNKSDILTPRLQSIIDEKIEKLACDLPPLPQDSVLWNGNETHELLLPIKISPNATENRITSNDLPDSKANATSLKIWSYEGKTEIQSGDVLLVRIDDSKLVQKKTIINHTDIREQIIERILHEPPTAVYQVTRTGHEQCDITEGILLDINPLKIDNRKVVTLYDKDLTEGINLLIVVSELWGSQCVRLKVTVKSDNCGENEDCSGKGLCYSNNSMEGYECQCCPGFVGPHCEEQDACYPSPCKNNGICVDISQGHEGSTFQCLCPYGFTGKTCEEETDPCTSMPCQNGATCYGNLTQFICKCPLGYSGPLCQHNLNECDSSPCMHGICVDQEDGYKCFCQPGFSGDHCEYEYNECESVPCINGGLCTDRVDDYFCTCGRGFTGKRCEIKVDLCVPNPCSVQQYCVDHGNNYTCHCPTGYSGFDCSISPRTACSTNPCTNGGTCWSSMNSFYCACRPGFTGKICEDEFVVETITDTDNSASNDEFDLEMPVSIHLDHLHNIYIAVGTLICAFLIVALIVTVCHCRVNQTYKRIMLRVYPLRIPKCRRKPDPPPTSDTNRYADSGRTNKKKESAKPGSDNPTRMAKKILIPMSKLKAKSLRDSTGRRIRGSLILKRMECTTFEWFSGKDKAPTATPSRNLPSLDADMYYTLDFADNQNSPLIQ